MDAAERTAWQEADRVFAALLELPAGERTRRFDAMQLEGVLRERVSLLLSSIDRDVAWIDRRDDLAAAWSDALSTKAAESMIGRRFGVWRIEEELGRGGMAVIYRARRVDGAADQVAALKLLTIASIGRDGSERFRRETDILAHLAHPAIVGLLDAGVAADGTPWLAMPLVDGIHIDAWCEQRRCDVREIVGLVVQVAGAVAAAHRSLVIHRDLKPSNVLVDGEGRTHLLDFGIARLVDHAEEATRTQWRALTPQYAAPEQFGGEPPTTLVDIYGLGALLHRLLHGTPPPRADEAPARAGAFSEAQGAGARPRHAVDSDLARVLRKALEADPERRYGTAEAFAADLRRWLSGQPVLAAPPSRLHRLRKFASRHRVGVAASAGLLLMLAIGVAAVLWQSARAQREAARALAVKGLLIDILESADPTQTYGADPTASELLSRGARRVRGELSDRPELQAEMLLLIGRAQMHRSRLEAARETLDTALALHEDGRVANPVLHAQTRTARGLLAYELGKNDEALEYLRTADRIAFVDDELRWRIRAHLADHLVVDRNPGEASAVAAGVVSAMRQAGRTGAETYLLALRSLGAAAGMQGRHEEAIALLEQAAAALARDHPESEVLASTYNELGLANYDARRIDAAENAWKLALAGQLRMFGERNAATLSTLGNLAGLHLARGDSKAAIPEFERILALLPDVLGTDLHVDLATNRGWLALAHYQAGAVEDAARAADSAFRMYEQLAAGERELLDWIVPLAGVLRHELGEADAAALLARNSADCDDLAGQRPIGRWACLAQRLDEADHGRCLARSTPVPSTGTLGGIERRWWAVHWLLQARCGTTEDAARAAAAIDELAAGAEPPFPEWLRRRIEALPVAAPAAPTDPAASP